MNVNPIPIELLERLEQRAAQEHLTLEALLAQWLAVSPAPDLSPAAVLRQPDSLLNQVSDAIIVMDRQLLITGWNTAAAQIYGWTAAEALGQQIDDLLKTEWLGAGQAQAVAALIAQGAWQGEIRQWDKAGQQHHIWAAVSWTRDRQGEIVGGVTVNRDITEQRRAEEDLHEREKMLSALIERSRDGVRILDDQQRIITWNAASEAQTGLKREAVLGKSFLEVTTGLLPDDHRTPEQVRQYRAALDRAVAGVSDDDRNTVFPEHRIRRTDGTIRIVETEIFAIQVSRKTYICGITRDITERKQAEAERRASEERYAAFITHSFEGISRTEFDHPIDISLPVEDQIDLIYANAYMAECNQALVDMYRLPSVQTMIGMRLIEAHGGKDNPINRAAFRRLIENDYRSFNEETLEYDAQGSPIWFLSNTVGIVEHGYLVRLWGTALEITERKQAEAALRASEERYKLLTELMSDFALAHRVNPDGSLETEWVTGTAFLEHVGYDQVPADLWDITHPGDLARVRQDIARTLKNEPTTSEYRIRKRDGAYIWISASRHPVWDTQQGRVVRYYNIVRDITERKQAEEALRHSEAKFRLFVEQSYEGILMADADGTVIDWNRAMEQLTGVDRRDVLGKPVWDVQHNIIARSNLPPDYAATRLSTLEALKTGHAAWIDNIVEYELTLADQKKRCLQVQTFPVQTEQGRLLAIIVRDVTTLKQAEQTLRASEEKYRSLIESADASISMVDYAGHYLFVNAIAAAPFGVAPEALVGKTVTELFVPAEANQILRDVQMVIDSEQGMVLEPAVIIAGKQCWFRTSIQPVRDSSGRPFAAMIYAAEITDKKLAEFALRASEARYRLIVETSQEGIWMLDTAGKTTFVNQRMAEMLGYTPEELLGREQLNFMDELGRVEAQRHLSQLRQGSAAQTDFRFVRKDGAEVWTIVSASPLLAAQGEYTGALNMIADITERRRAESQLRLQNAALEAAANAILITDHENRIQWCNPAFTRLSGYTLDEAFGKYPEELVRSGVEGSAFYDRIQETVQSGQIWQGRLINRRKDGNLYVEEQTITPVADLTGRITHFIAIKQDVTEREQAEQLRLEQQRLTSNLKKEQEFNALMQKAVSALSHDLRTPLTVIATAKDTLERHFDHLNPEQRRQKLDSIDRQLHYVTQLLDDLSLTVKGSLEQRVFQPEPVNLAALCQISINEIQETSGRQHHLRFDSDGHLKTVLVDETLVSRILINLLSNAVKFSPPGSEIRLSLSQREHWIVLRVKDHGIGIDSADLPHIFEPFYRAQAAHRIGGTGLGLNIVHDCIKRHQGRIHVESQPQHGAVFTVELPLALP